MDTEGEIYILEKGDKTIPGSLRDVKNLKLRIWNIGFAQFDELANFPNLTELEMMGYDGPSFTPLRPLRRLRRLTIIHFPHVSELEPLEGLSDVEELTLETLPGGDASGKHKVVARFRPLQALQKLRVLKLAGIRAEDGDLSPLGALTALQELALGNFFSQQQFAQLAKRLPHVRCPFLAPYLLLEGSVCGKCNGKKVLLSGADVPNPKVVCPVCHRKKFETTVARFERFKEGVSPAMQSTGVAARPIYRWMIACGDICHRYLPWARRRSASG